MQNKMKITIMGGGNNGKTMAADLSLAGFKVSLFELPEFKSNIQLLKENKALLKIGLGRNGLAKLDKVTTDTAEAVKDANVIIIAVPAFGHTAFFEEIAEKLKRNQIVLIAPGNWGALKLYNLLNKKGINGIKIAETNACMHICRASENWLDQHVTRIILERKSVQIAAMPAKDNKDIFKVLNQIYPIFTLATNVLETSLNNDNPMYHGPIVLMNAGWLEYTKGQFMIYRDGLTPSIGKCIDKLSKERDNVLRAVDIKPQPTTSSYQLIKDSKWPNDPCEVGPENLQNRYITEDVPYGLVPLTYLGDLMDVNTPLSDAIIEIASTVNENNYWKKGTTLEKLELNEMKPKEILRFLNKGK